MMAIASTASEAHMTADAVASLLENELAMLAAPHGGAARLTAFGLHKACADATTKMFVHTEDGEQVLAVLIISRRAAPDLIDRGIQAAEAIRSLIGPALGAAIVQPFSHGYADGLSYVLLPWCREFSAWRPWRVVQRRRLRGPLFRWLRSATAAAVQGHGDRSDAKGNFIHALEHLVRQPELADDLSGAARLALERLESEQWHPRHTFDHNDLYLSNIMLPAAETSAASHHPFVLIDWAGANPDGFGMYDLIRLARAFRLPAAVLRGELAAHAAALHCDEHDLAGHLLAALGRLHQHLEHFPEERFMATAEACWTVYRHAVHRRSVLNGSAH